MVGHAFVVDKEVIHHSNGNNFTPGEWFNGEKYFFM